MANFPIISTERQLSGQSQNIEMPVSLAESGKQQIYEGVAQAGQALMGLGRTFAEIQKRKQALIDTRSELQADNLYRLALSNAELKNEQTSPDLWESNLAEETKKIQGQINSLPFTDNARKVVNLKLSGQYGVDRARTLTNSVKQIRSDTQALAVNELMESVVGGDPNKIEYAKQKVRDSFSMGGTSKREYLQSENAIRAAEEEGTKLADKAKVNNAFNNLRGVAKNSGWEIAQKTAIDPNWQDSMGLDGEQSHKVLIAINAQAGIERGVENENRIKLEQETDLKASKLFAEDRFPYDQYLLFKPDMSPQMQLHFDTIFRNVIENEKIRKAKIEEFKNPVARDFIGRIYDTNDSTQLDSLAIEIKANPNIPATGEGSTEHFLGEIDKRKTEIRNNDIENTKAIQKYNTLALKVYTGEITKDQYLYGFGTGSERINGVYVDTVKYGWTKETVDKLLDKAYNPLTPEQGRSLADADERAGRALVDYKSEPEWLAAFSAATGEEKKTLSDKRKLQFELLNQYNDLMKDYLVKNPQASGKDFEQFRDSKRYDYINKRTELEKTIKGKIENFGQERPVVEQRKAGETVAEYLKRTG